ncbi:MAG: GNAT family N-acetyltransferase [Deltaproteobacteria bacterium]|nr:GNAT family N-acetyltransferase [Deltaproteobacteria bacterium]MBW2415865.1 GNAT family N-acetyltransferase [Deltaproteobacteria bacterium]
MWGLEISVARAGDLDAYVDLLEEAGSWLWEREIRQWEPGSHRAQRPRLARDVERGAVRLARAGAQLAGGVILDWERGPVWDGFEGEAGYVYKLVVARASAGRGVGARLLRHCEEETRQRGRRWVRLDCWSGNARLRAYYEDAGYAPRGQAREHGASVSLFEKPVSGPGGSLESGAPGA